MEQLLRELKEILRGYFDLQKVRPKAPDACFKAQKILRKIRIEDVTEALKSWHERVIAETDKLVTEKTNSFIGLFSEFIRRKQEEKISTMEFDNRWRVGCLEIHLRQDTSQIMLSYNKQTIINYKTVASAEDINHTYEEANNMLSNCLIEISRRVQLFYETYEFLQSRNIKNANLIHTQRVPLKDFFNEFKLTYIRANHYKIKDFPEWAFLYNLDDYMRPEHNEIKGERRLLLFTGSQRESSTIGMVTNGLDANYDYKTYCYIGKG